MRRAIIYFLVCFAFCPTINAQDKLAIVSFIKKGKIILRWAPETESLWKSGNLYGYKIERIPSSYYNQNPNDTSRSVILNTQSLKPWKQNDERWKNLLSKNKAAAFVHGTLYSNDPKATPAKKTMAFGMSMKSCDLYRELSEAHGLTFIDSLFNENENYVYRVSI